jgi:hypothetical protein
MTHDRILRLRSLFASPEDAARHAASEGLAWIAESRQAAAHHATAPSHDAPSGLSFAHTLLHRPAAV